MKKKDILLMQEIERKRIAEELHDTTVQDMIHLSQQLEIIMHYIDSDTTQAKLETASARKQIKGIISGIRETIYDLRPITFDDIGWTVAINRLKDKLLNTNPDLNVLFDIDNIDTSDGVTAISIYRIVCECCQNIVKHSKANNIKVFIKYDYADNLIKVCVHDDGIGFNDDDDEFNSNHFGIQFMRERVEMLFGKFEILSNSLGTSVNIEIPFNVNPVHI